MPRKNKDTEQDRRIDRHEYVLFGPDGCGGLSKAYEELAGDYQCFKGQITGWANKIIGGCAVVAFGWALFKVVAPVLIRHSIGV